jgi:hypothetical protein
VDEAVPGRRRGHAGAEPGGGRRAGRIAWTVIGAMPRRVGDRRHGRAAGLERRPRALAGLPEAAEQPAHRRPAPTAGCGRPTRAWSAARR